VAPLALHEKVLVSPAFFKTDHAEKSCEQCHGGNPVLAPSRQRHGPDHVPRLNPAAWNHPRGGILHARKLRKGPAPGLGAAEWTLLQERIPPQEA